MQAVRIHEYGAPDVLVAEEIPDPEPGDGEVLVEVAAIGTLFSETQLRSGALARFGLALPPLPQVFGRDIAGTIAAVGANVDREWLGQRVITSTSGTGGYAQRAVVSAAPDPQARTASWSCLTPIPEGLAFEDACALLGQGRTALGLVELAAIREGQAVLVTAAAGAVGSLLLQLARRAGATVVAAAGGAHKLDLAGSLGADVLIDYTDPEWVDKARSQLPAGGVHVAFDAIGASIGRGAADLLLDGEGMLITYGISSGAPLELPTAEILGRAIGLMGYGGPRFASRPDRIAELQAEALALAAAGELVPVIGQRFALQDAAAAHQAMESRDTVGKTLLFP